MRPGFFLGRVRDMVVKPLLTLPPVANHGLCTTRSVTCSSGTWGHSAGPAESLSSPLVQTINEVGNLARNSSGRKVIDDFRQL